MLTAFNDIELAAVKIAGEDYPIYCDIHALQRIQEEGYKLQDFERGLMGLYPLDDGTVENGPVNLKTVSDALRIFLEEGMIVYNMLHPYENKYPSPETIASELAVLYRGQYVNLAILLYSEFAKCFDDGKKKESPPPKKRTRSRKSRTSTSSST